MKDQLNKQHYLVLCSYHTHCVYILHMCDYEKPKKNSLEQTTRLRGYTMEVTVALMKTFVVILCVCVYYFQGLYIPQKS